MSGSPEGSQQTNKKQNCFRGKRGRIAESCKGADTACRAACLEQRERASTCPAWNKQKIIKCCSHQLLKKSLTIRTGNDFHALPCATVLAPGGGWCWESPSSTHREGEQAAISQGQLRGLLSCQAQNAAASQGAS